MKSWMDSDIVFYFYKFTKPVIFLQPTDWGHVGSAVFLNDREPRDGVKKTFRDSQSSHYSKGWYWPCRINRGTEDPHCLEIHSYWVSFFVCLFPVSIPLYLHEENVSEKWPEHEGKYSGTFKILSKYFIL